MQRDVRIPALIAGWREWVGLPELGIDTIKAKLDVGARTSALHAVEVVPFDEDGRPRVRFTVHPHQGDRGRSVRCQADVVDRRAVKNSGGSVEERWVIRTPVRLGSREWPIEITLTDRADMRFRMLIGRAAMRGRLLVHPGRSYLLPHPAPPPPVPPAEHP